MRSPDPLVRILALFPLDPDADVRATSDREARLRDRGTGCEIKRLAPTVRSDPLDVDVIIMLDGCRLKAQSLCRCVTGVTDDKVPDDVPGGQSPLSVHFRLGLMFMMDLKAHTGRRSWNRRCFHVVQIVLKGVSDLARQIFCIPVLAAQAPLLEVIFEGPQGVQLEGVDVVRQLTRRKVHVHGLAQLNSPVDLLDRTGDVDTSRSAEPVTEDSHYDVSPVHTLTINDCLGPITQLRGGMKLVEPRAQYETSACCIPTVPARGLTQDGVPSVCGVARRSDQDGHCAGMEWHAVRVEGLVTVYCCDMAATAIPFL